MKIIPFIIYSAVLISCSDRTEDHEKSNSSERMILLKEIENGMEREQAIREEFIMALETTGFDMELNTKMGAVDSINQGLVIRYLDKYIWPMESEVGRNISKSFFLVVQHGELELMKKHFEAFHNLSKRGEANKVEVAMMQDRILMYEGKRQLFGTQYGTRKDKNGYITTDYYVWPIENVSEVNNRRDSVGFKNSLEEVAKEMNAEFNLNEELDTDIKSW